MTAICPTPWKISYGSRAAAVMDARQRDRDGVAGRKKGQLRPYRCDCGRWHLTSMPRAAVRMLRKRRAA